MSDLPPRPPETNPPLDYHMAPKKVGTGPGCLLGSILVAIAAAVYVIALFTGFTGENLYVLATILAMGTIVIIVGGVMAGRRGMSMALAITIASLCAAALCFSLCTAALFTS